MESSRNEEFLGVPFHLAFSVRRKRLGGTPAIAFLVTIEASQRFAGCSGAEEAPNFSELLTFRYRNYNLFAGLRPWLKTTSAA
jgi:hypothetical protein